MQSVPTPIYYEITPELGNLGITSIYSVGKLLLLNRNNGGEPQEITCRFDIKDPVKSVDNYLKKELTEHNFSAEDNKKICHGVMQAITKSIHQTVNEATAKVVKEQLNIDKVLGEIDQLREENPNLTFEIWQNKLIQKFQQLHDDVNNNMPEIWEGLEYELSILRILDLADCDLPFIGIILGRPSSSKTFIITALRKWIKAFYTDNFTARSFVSHSTAVDSEEELRKIDLLTKIANKLLLTPELSPLFTSKEDDLMQLLGIITRIADGQGYSNESGAHGHREYGETMFTWVGAAVDIPYKVYEILHTLGFRMYFFRMKFEEQTSEELEKFAKEARRFSDKRQPIIDALFDYLKWFEICPIKKPKIEWDWDSDSVEALKYIAGMADLLSYLRCTAKVWETKDSQGSEYGYTVSQREKPTRAITHLKNLARGHAQLAGRNHITLDDIHIVIKTALDTAPIERVSLLSLLIANNGKLTTDQILESLNISRKSALRTMAEFKVIGLVTVEDFRKEGQNNYSKRMVLNSRFNRFLSDPMITKIIPHTTPKNNDIENRNGQLEEDKEDLFWGEYMLLEIAEKNDPSNYSETDKNTVNGTKLIQQLIQTGQFYNGDAEDMIKSMVDSGKLEMVMMDTYRRKV